MSMMPPSPAWLQSALASNARERIRLREELGKMKGALPLLMKPRNGERWSAADRNALRSMLRAASSVSPYLVVLALPGSVMLLPILAWRLDVRRGRRTDTAHRP
jgi:hypothetical protein